MIIVIIVAVVVGLIALCFGIGVIEIADKNDN